MEIKKMFKVLSLSAHCLCEQGYCVSGLLDIVRFIEEKAGISAETVLADILKTAEFHREWDKQEYQKQKALEKEIVLAGKREHKFNSLPGQVREQLVKECGGYWNAVENYSKNRRIK